jgi:hypothetical protein
VHSLSSLIPSCSHTHTHSLSLILTLTFYIISHHKAQCKECKGSSICEHGKQKVSALTLFFDPFMLTHTHTHSLSLSLSLSLSYNFILLCTQRVHASSAYLWTRPSRGTWFASSVFKTRRECKSVQSVSDQHVPPTSYE